MLGNIQMEVSGNFLQAPSLLVQVFQGIYLHVELESANDFPMLSHLPGQCAPFLFQVSVMTKIIEKSSAILRSKRSQLESLTFSMLC